MRTLLWRKLNRGILDCKRCDLKGRKRVLGAGSHVGRVLIVGEAPGKAEIRLKVPFVGPSGRLLRQALSDLDVKSVYITNAVKCHPPANRKPTAEEIKACAYWLNREISLLKPEQVVKLGVVAVRATRAIKGGYVPHPSVVVRGLMAVSEFFERLRKALKHG